MNNKNTRKLENAKLDKDPQNYITKSALASLTD